MRELTTFIIALLVLPGLVCTVAAGEFYAHYTRLPYVIPLDQADYMATQPDAESRAILEAMEDAEEDEEEREEDEESAASGAERRITGKYADIVVSAVDLLIGLNNQPGRATDPVRSPICHMPVIYGIEGLIDEVKIYDQKLSDACIEQVNFRSNFKVFLIFQEGAFISPWGTQGQSRHTDDPFAGPWNHWPVSQIPSDGRFAVANDRLTHAAVAAADNVTEHFNMAIYGFNDRGISALVPLARFWNHPPPLSNTKGCTSRGYDKAQRAYVLSAGGPKLSFTVRASRTSPLVNPAFVVNNWKADWKAVVEINS